MVQPIQNLNLGAPLLRPVEGRRFPEAAGRVAATVTKVVLAAIAAVVSFVLLPWQAAAGVTAAAGLLLLLCCRGGERRIMGEGGLAPAPAPIVLIDQGAAAYPRNRWFHRVGGFFQRGVHVADPRPREAVGLGQLNPPPADVGFRPMAPRNARHLARGGDREVAGARYHGDGGFFGRAARGEGAVHPPGGAPIGRPPAAPRGGEHEPVGRPARR